MRLTPNFTLNEFTDSQTATREGIDNTPTDYTVMNLLTVAYTLEIIRIHLGSSIHISSGYRSLKLNEAVGGSKQSKHMEGLAADFTVEGYTPREAVQAIRNIVGYNKLILEFASGNGGWVHLDLAAKLEMEVLEAKKISGVTVYEVLRDEHIGMEVNSGMVRWNH